MLFHRRLTGRPHAARLWATSTVCCAVAGGMLVSTAWAEPNVLPLSDTLDGAIARELNVLRSSSAMPASAAPERLPQMPAAIDPALYGGTQIQQVADEAASSGEEKSETLRALEEMYRRNGQEMPPMRLQDAPNTRLKNGQRVVLPPRNEQEAKAQQARTSASGTPSFATNGGAKSSAAPARLPSSSVVPAASRQEFRETSLHTAALSGPQPPIPPVTRTAGTQGSYLPPAPSVNPPEPEKKSFFGRMFSRKSSSSEPQPYSSSSYATPSYSSSSYNSSNAGSPPAYNPQNYGSTSSDPSSAEMASAANPVGGSRRGPASFFGKLFRRDSASNGNTAATQPQEDLPEIRNNVQFGNAGRSSYSSTTPPRVQTPPPAPAAAPANSGPPTFAASPTFSPPPTFSAPSTLSAPAVVKTPAPMPAAPAMTARPMATAPVRVATAPSSTTSDFGRPEIGTLPAPGVKTGDNFPPGTFPPIGSAPIANMPAPAPAAEDIATSPFGADDPFAAVRGQTMAATNKFPLPAMGDADAASELDQPHPLEALNISSAAPTHLDPSVAAQAQPADPVARDTANRYALLKQKLAERANQNGFQGFCPVALRDQRELIDANPAFLCMFEGKAYQVESAESKARFDANPLKYAPVHHGNDVILSARGADQIAGNLNYAAWYKDRLYLFRTAETMREFQADPTKYAPHH